MKLKPYCTRLVHVPLNQPEKLTHAQKHESQHNDRLLLQQIRNTQAKEMAVGPLARLLAQLVVPVISVLARALPAAYAQALQNARKAGVSHEEATKAASQMLRKTLSKTEALQILNLSETEATAEAIQKVRMNSLCPLIPSCLKIDCHNQFTHSFVHTFSLTQQFDRYMKAKRGQVDAKIISAEPLTAAQLKEVEAAMQSQVEKGKSVVLTAIIDPSIVGGLQVQIGDQFLDLSVKSRIEEISRVSL